MWGKAYSMIVLAGGKSSRMGRDKSDLTFGGKTFLQMQIEKARTLGIEDIQVSGYRGTACDIPATPDRIPGKGPLGGLESCLRKAKNQWCLVVGVDFPLIPVSELENLLLASAHSGATVTILKHGGREQPLLAVYHQSLADAMLEEITQRKGSVFAFLNRIGYAVYESTVDEKYMVNVNSPEVYASVRESFLHFM